MSFAIFVCILSAAIQLVLAAIVIAKSTKKAENRLFSVLLILFTGWSLAELNLLINGPTETAMQLLFTPGLLLSYFFCIFTAIYPERHANAAIIRNRKNTILFAIPAMIVLYFLWNGQLIEGFDAFANGFTIDLGKFEFLLKGVLVGYLFISLSTLSKSREMAESKIQIRRLRYTFTAMLLPVAAGSIIIAFSRWFVGGATMYSYGIFPVLSILMSIILSYTMLKYNLMEIDMIFSIGLVYTLLTAIMAGFMELLQELMQEILNFSDVWSKVIAILFIAAFFSPVKDWLISAVDRFFGKQTFDSAKVMQTILNQLRKISDQKKLFQHLLSELNMVLDFSYATIAYEGTDSIVFPADHSSPDQAFLDKLPESASDIDFYLHFYREKGEKDKALIAERLKQAGICHYFHIDNNQNNVRANLNLGPKTSKLPYSDTELNLVQGILNEVPHIIANLEMINRLLRQEKISQEIGWAQKMLRSISADCRTREFQGLQLAMFASLSEEVKGDMIDICDKKENSFAALYDAFNHGIPAVLTLNIIFAIMRCFENIDQKIPQLNRALRSFSQNFCSAITLISRNSDDGIRIINAGNPSPLLLSNGVPQPLISQQTKPIGLDEDYTIAEHTTQLKAGEMLLVSSNGLYKAFSELHNQSLIDYLTNKTFADVESCKNEILKSIEPLTRRSYSDDITFILAGKIK